MANLSYKLDEDILDVAEYKGIKQMLDRLQKSGIMERLQGNCVSACDIIQNMLNFYGVSAKTVECQLMAVKENNQTKDFCFVGFDEIGRGNNSVDSHVVVVTLGNQPVLIDAAIGNLLPGDNQIVVRKLTSVDPDIIGEFKLDDVTLTYQNKKQIKLPELHQKNLIERLKEQTKVNEKINTLNKWVIIGLAIGGINILFNFTLLTLRLIFDIF